MFAANDLQIAGDRDEEIADLCGLLHRHDAEPVHDRFDRLDRIDFGDDDIGAHPFGAHCDAAPTPAVACDHEGGAADQPVRCADNAVDGALARAIAVVEEVLGVGVVDGDYRELQHFLLGHAAEADDAGGGFFRAADHMLKQILPLGMDEGDDIGSVVHGDVRLVGDGRLDVLIVRLIIFAFDGEGRNAVMLDEGRRDFILCAEGIGGAEPDFGAAGLERLHQIGRFGCHMEAGGHAQAFEGLLLLETLLDQPQHRHGGFGPFDLEFALVCELEIFHIVFHENLLRDEWCVIGDG